MPVESDGYISLHGFDAGFDEGDFFGREVVFAVELLVDFGDRDAPVDVGGGGEVLEGNF